MKDRKANPSRPVRISKRATGIEPFHVMSLLARARALEARGVDVIHMEVGEPDFSTPAPVIEAVRAVLGSAAMSYTPAEGLPALREAIAALYETRYAVEVAPERILVTPGASGAILLALSLITDAGDEVLMCDPGYPCYQQVAGLLGITPSIVDVTVDNNFQPTPGQLDDLVSERARALLLTSPSNPTGTIIAPEVMEQLSKWSRSRQVALVADEIYHGLVYEGRCPTALEFEGDHFVVGSFSKYFGLTGWRVGWLVVPDGWTEPAARIAQNLYLAAPTPGQHAALAALSPAVSEILEDRRATFAARRDRLRPAVESLGFQVLGEPDGAFYLYADASRFTDDTNRYCSALMEQTGVVLTPGIDFGRRRARQRLRFAYTCSETEIDTAMERLANWID